jgi:hypothetical protein
MKTGNNIAVWLNNVNLLALSSQLAVCAEWLT